MEHTAATAPGDDSLLADLHRVVAVGDPVPDDWRAAASSSFRWSSIDAEAAELAYDSISGRDRRIGGGHISGFALRELRYVAGARAIELELDVGDDKLRVLGRLIPARRADVVATWPEGRRVTTTDDDGAFRFDELPRRPLSVYVTGDHRVKTGWILT
jgi:hypothetical protein